MTIATLVSSKPEGGGDGGTSDKAVLPAVMLETPEPSSPYGLAPPCPQTGIIFAGTLQSPLAPSWSWCGLTSSLIGLLCCWPCGFVATIASVLSYVDHKVRDYEGSSRKKAVAFWTATCAITLGCLALFIFIIVAAVSFPKLANVYTSPARGTWVDIIEETEEELNTSDLTGGQWLQDFGEQLQNGLQEMTGSLGNLGDLGAGLVNISFDLGQQTQEDVAMDDRKIDDRENRKEKEEEEGEEEGKEDHQEGSKSKKMESWMMDPMAEHDPSLHPLPKGFLGKWYKDHPQYKPKDFDENGAAMREPDWDEPMPEKRWRN